MKFLFKLLKAVFYQIFILVYKIIYLLWHFKPLSNEKMKSQLLRFQAIIEGKYSIPDYKSPPPKKVKS